MAPVIRSAALLFVVTVMLFSAGGSQGVTGGVVRINGSGATLDIVQTLAKEYRKNHPEVQFIIDKPLGSSGAIKALLAGALDIAVSSKGLKNEDAAKGASSRDYGKLPFAVVTAGDVGKSDITIRELEDIYAGKKTKWPNGETIRVILRPKDDVDSHILGGLSPGLERALHDAHKRPGMILAVTDPEATEAISKTPGGIGTATICCAIPFNGKLKALSLNGKAATPKAVADGTYPLAKDMRFITTRTLSPTALDFLRFIYSDKGRAIARSEGVVVAKNGDRP